MAEEVSGNKNYRFISVIFNQSYRAIVSNEEPDTKCRMS